MTDEQIAVAAMLGHLNNSKARRKIKRAKRVAQPAPPKAKKQRSRKRKSGRKFFGPQQASCGNRACFLCARLRFAECADRTAKAAARAAPTSPRITMRWGEGLTPISGKASAGAPGLG